MFLMLDLLAVCRFGQKQPGSRDWRNLCINGQSTQQQVFPTVGLHHKYNYISGQNYAQ